MTPNRFGRCTSRERLRQHRLLPPPCVLQSPPSAYPSRDNCRRHGDAPLIGTRIIPLGEQIDPRIADRRTWRGQGPFNWRLLLENPPRMWCPVSVVLPTAVPHSFHALQPAVVASYVGTVPRGSSMRLSARVRCSEKQKTIGALLYFSGVLLCNAQVVSKDQVWWYPPTTPPPFYRD